MGEKERTAMENSARLRRTLVARQYDLTPAEMARTRTLTAGDPVSNYAGYPEIQAQMIADERDPLNPSIVQRAINLLKRAGSAALDGFAANGLVE